MEMRQSPRILRLWLVDGARGGVKAEGFRRWQELGRRIGYNPLNRIAPMVDSQLAKTMPMVQRK